jgi:hypothetical protein
MRLIPLNDRNTNCASMLGCPLGIRVSRLLGPELHCLIGLLVSSGTRIFNIHIEQGSMLDVAAESQLMFLQCLT